jgi:transcription elongation factor GreB
MSRAFVKENDADPAGIALPERPRTAHTNYVTAAGLAALKAQFLTLLDTRSELSVREDMESKQQNQAVERDLRYLQDRLESAILVNPDTQPDDRVHFGSTVHVVDEDDRRHVFQIVGEDEADVARGKISWFSPLSKALLDTEVGDVVTWRRPAGDMELEVVAIVKQMAPADA